MKIGIRGKDEVVVVVYRNSVSLGEIVLRALSNQELSVSVFIDNETDLVVMHEAIVASGNAVNFHLQRPRLRELLNERIAELKAEDEAGEVGEPPFPIDDHNIPF